MANGLMVCLLVCVDASAFCDTLHWACDVTMLTLVQITVYVKVGDIYRVPDFVIALDELGQTLIEKPLD